MLTSVNKMALQVTVEARYIIHAMLQAEALSRGSDELLSDSCWVTEQPTDHTWNLQQTHLYLELHPGSATQHKHYNNNSFFAQCNVLKSHGIIDNKGPKK